MAQRQCEEENPGPFIQSVLSESHSMLSPAMEQPMKMDMVLALFIELPVTTATPQYHGTKNFL